MANENQVQMLKTKSMEDWNQFWQGHPGSVLDLKGADLAGLSLGGRKFLNGDLQGADLRGCGLANCDFTDAKLQGAHLDKANLTDARLVKADLANATLSGAILSKTHLGEATLDGIDISDLTFKECDLQQASCKRVIGNAKTVFKTCVLAYANFTGAVLNGAQFLESKASYINLEQAKLKGSELTGEFSSSKLIGADLTGAMLPNADCAGIKADAATRFDEATLIGTKFSSIIARSTSFKKANASRASFENSDLDMADFSSAELSHANFRAASLCEAQFQGANLFETDLSRAAMMHVSGVYTARNLGTTSFPNGDARYFDTCERDWWEQHLDWEHIRKIGNIKILGVSYTLLLFLISSFYLIDHYNQKVELAKHWADGVKQTHNNMETGLREKLDIRDRAVVTLAEQVSERLNKWYVHWSSILLFFSTLILLCASGIYGWHCPDEVKDFTQTQWRYQLNRSLVHYWAHSWKKRQWRKWCAALYAVGGVASGFLVIWKGAWAIHYIWDYVT